MKNEWFYIQRWQRNRKLKEQEEKRKKEQDEVKQ